MSQSFHFYFQFSFRNSIQRSTNHVLANQKPMTFAHKEGNIPSVRQKELKHQFQYKIGNQGSPFQ